GGGVAFSPDGKRLAWAAGKAVKLTDADNGKEVASFPEGPGIVTAVAFAADGKRLAAAADGGMGRLWGAEGGKEQARRAGAGALTAALECLPDGTPRLTGRDGSLLPWDPATRATARLYPGQGETVPTAVGRLGKLVAVVAPAETVRVHDHGGATT